MLTCNRTPTDNWFRCQNVRMCVLVTLLLFAGAGARMYPPTDSSWIRNATHRPVLWPTLPWEGIVDGNPCVCENVAMFDAPRNEFVMFYRGGWNKVGVGRATSTDGVTWVKTPSPVFGIENPSDGGEPWVFHEGTGLDGTLLLHTTNNGGAPPGPHVVVATSTDRGFTWVRMLNSTVPLPLGATLFGNRVIWKEGPSFLMLLEVLAGPWMIYLYSSVDGVKWSLGNAGLPLVSLDQVTPSVLVARPTPTLFRLLTYAIPRSHFNSMRVVRTAARALPA